MVNQLCGADIVQDLLLEQDFETPHVKAVRVWGFEQFDTKHSRILLGCAHTAIPGRHSRFWTTANPSKMGPRMDRQARPSRAGQPPAPTSGPTSSSPGWSTRMGRNRTGWCPRSRGRRIMV
eukprot:EG_transcript_42894